MNGTWLYLATVDWLDIACTAGTLNICLSESQAFPEAKSVESVDFTHFILGENCDQTYLNLQFYFITYILLLNTGGKEFIEIKDKSICFQIIKSLRLDNDFILVIKSSVCGENVTLNLRHKYVSIIIQLCI